MQDFVFGSLSTDEKRFAALQEWHQGIRHHSLVEPRAPQAEDSPTLTVIVGVDQVIERVECVLLEPETAVYPLTLQTNEWDMLNWRYVQTWTATLPPRPNGTIVRYKICAYPADSDELIWADHDELFAYYVGAAGPPAWSQDAIIYQIFPDRFAIGNGRAWPDTHDLNQLHGGTLRGIIEKLDYIAGMGFNCIWLNPFLPDDTHHRYHATNYFLVDPTVGTLEDIRELVEQAHARGIRLLFDFVANHWGIEHEVEVDGRPFKSFYEAQADQESPFHGWYHWIDWPHDWMSFFGVKHLPQVNVNHPDVRQYLINSALFWLCDVGFDGFRFDYALGPSNEFWTEMYATLKQAKPDAWLFGEVVETPTTIRRYEGRMDGCLDFLMLQAFKDTFAHGRMSLTAFNAFLGHHEQYFSDTFSLPSFLDNHDMNRFLFSAGGDVRRLKLALLCLFTLSGPPVIYYGTEIGLHQNLAMEAPDSQGMAECRQPMAWDETSHQSEIKPYLTQLIQMRRTQTMLTQGSRHTVHLDEATQTYVYCRSFKNQSMLVGFNLSDTVKIIDVDDPVSGIKTRLELAPMAGKTAVF